MVGMLRLRCNDCGSEGTRSQFRAGKNGYTCRNCKSPNVLVVAAAKDTCPVCNKNMIYDGEGVCTPCRGNITVSDY